MGNLASNRLDLVGYQESSEEFCVAGKRLRPPFKNAPHQTGSVRMQRASENLCRLGFLNDSARIHDQDAVYHLR